MENAKNSVTWITSGELIFGMVILACWIYWFIENTWWWFCHGKVSEITRSSWWFQTFFIFPIILGMSSGPNCPSHWRTHNIWDNSGYISITQLYMELLLIGGLEVFHFPYIGNNHPNWRSPSFFRGVGQPPTSYGDNPWVIDLLLRFANFEIHFKIHLCIPPTSILAHEKRRCHGPHGGSPVVMV